MSHDAVYRHHREHLNNALRRPGMYSRDESAEFLLLEAMAAVDGGVERWRAEYAALRSSGLFTATGVRGAYSGILPAGMVRDAAASAYAGIAHRLGWLDLDRVLTNAEYQQLGTGIREWVTEDRTWSDLTGEFGDPSLRIGGSNVLWSKTLAYATADPADGLICVHLWNALADTLPGEGVRGVLPEPVVLAVRHDHDDFSFTPEGRRRRPTRSPDPVRSTVWVFNGPRSRFPSAVFATSEDGLAWAAEHGVSGVLAEYAFGGAYDAAVRDGRFSPSKPHHGTPDHIAGFGPGLNHIHLVDGRPDA
ncbi:hypothetical protein [Actinoplanes utahensis]|nr:hypothetical protein [Actinoplanes utahensis]